MLPIAQSAMKPPMNHINSAEFAIRRIRRPIAMIRWLISRRDIYFAPCCHHLKGRIFAVDIFISVVENYCIIT
jgi:hypothetical protein